MRCRAITDGQMPSGFLGFAGFPVSCSKAPTCGTSVPGPLVPRPQSAPCTIVDASRPGSGGGVGGRWWRMVARGGGAGRVRVGRYPCSPYRPNDAGAGARQRAGGQRKEGGAPDGQFSPSVEFAPGNTGPQGTAMLETTDWTGRKTCGLPVCTPCRPMQQHSTLLSLYRRYL